MFRTSSRLNRFLQSFILNENPNYSYTVVDPMLPPSEGSKSIFDRLARTPPQMISEGSGGENKSIFHACRHNEWTDCLVYGNEHGMILFNILTCSVCDLWFGDTVTSILLTYLLMGVHHAFPAFVWPRQSWFEDTGRLPLLALIEGRGACKCGAWVYLRSCTIFRFVETLFSIETY